ncbi:MAG: hypothetical protein JSR91_00420 [Proteobacteria bacterium]|nr:hypothetical protein [Pseudomonadota bacterium]
MTEPLPAPERDRLLVSISRRLEKHPGDAPWSCIDCYHGKACDEAQILRAAYRELRRSREVLSGNGPETSAHSENTRRPAGSGVREAELSAMLRQMADEFEDATYDMTNGTQSSERKELCRRARALAGRPADE